MAKQCARCGKKLAALTGGAWVESLRGEVCMGCFHILAGDAAVENPLAATGSEASEGRSSGASAEIFNNASKNVENSPYVNEAKWAQRLDAIDKKLGRIEILLLLLLILAALGLVLWMTR